MPDSKVWGWKLVDWLKLSMIKSPFTIFDPSSAHIPDLSYWLLCSICSLGSWLCLCKYLSLPHSTILSRLPVLSTSMDTQAKALGKQFLPSGNWLPCYYKWLWVFVLSDRKILQNINIRHLVRRSCDEEKNHCKIHKYQSLFLLKSTFSVFPVVMLFLVRPAHFTNEPL